MRSSSKEKYSPWMSKRRASRDIYEAEEGGEGEELLLNFIEWNKNISNQLSFSLVWCQHRRVCWTLDRRPVGCAIPHLHHAQRVNLLPAFPPECLNFLSSSESYDFIIGIPLAYCVLKLHLKSSSLSIYSQSSTLRAIFEFKAYFHHFSPQLN